MKQKDLNEIREETPEIKDLDSEEPNKTEEQKSVELDMNKFGDMDITSGGAKPIFEKVTRALVLSAILKTTPERKTAKGHDGKDQTFYPIFLAVHYNINGNEIFENYGGGKLFVSETDQSKKFWLGKDSALGKIKTVLEDNFDFKGTIKEIPKLMLGQNVGLKTEYPVVAGIKYTKNMIQVFYK